jgi:hypothetical protein
MLMSLSGHSKPCGVKRVVYRAHLKQTSLRVPPKACIQRFYAISGHTCNVGYLYKVNISQVSTVSAGVLILDTDITGT